MRFRSKQKTRFPLAYIWDLACNRDLASISTNYLDLRPVSGTQHLCGTWLLPSVVNKDLTLKAKAKAKDLSLDLKDKFKDCSLLLQRRQDLMLGGTKTKKK